MNPFIVGLAGLGFNAGILIFNWGFTKANEIAQHDPEMFSKQGQLLVLVWGLAYAAAGHDALKSGHSVAFIWAVFAIEKLIYVVHWVRWRQNNDLEMIQSNAARTGSWLDTLAPRFLANYGWGDAIFGLLFAHLFCEALWM
eukprot:CAMPEP_0195016826 /NCGR_PEP_ID=MMETSP0326_2-20130528/25588_1 /TAXON_ID=2866 ORGANISM="Crypthecodinium cohnii, Strain Seligo" /NCGR_SAMPLE_ID=MMETSP0326_2 /ASSEMBLY_ACC=CAM_ASM_000348 /LENGTH=140 /DNA_ID=CAMNT_0040032821 /DNA_START=23 /DNA_END=445 /DNA_ORIENTATION=+